MVSKPTQKGQENCTEWPRGLPGPPRCVRPHVSPNSTTTCHSQVHFTDFVKVQEDYVSCPRSCSWFNPVAPGPLYLGKKVSSPNPGSTMRVLGMGWGGSWAAGERRPHLQILGLPKRSKPLGAPRVPARSQASHPPLGTWSNFTSNYTPCH